MPPQPLHRNEITLVGRLSRAPWPVQLASGDEVVMLRLIVQRERVDGAPAPRPSSDSLTCAVRRPGLRRSAQRWNEGDVVEVTGALRSRFRRTEAGPRSVYEVEAASARRLARAP